MISHLPGPLRWLLLVPASLVAGWLTGALIHLLSGDGSGGPVAYAAAFASGLAYVWTALYTARVFAPTHGHIVVIVLGVLIVGDACVAQFIVQTGMIAQGPAAGDSGIGLLLSVLRAGDYSTLPHGGVVKIAGAVIGCLLAWRGHGAPRRPERPATPQAAN